MPESGARRRSGGFTATKSEPGRSPSLPSPPTASPLRLCSRAGRAQRLAEAINGQNVKDVAAEQRRASMFVGLVHSVLLRVHAFP